MLASTTCYNGKEVLIDINLTIRSGEHVALVGKSGAGKSTLLALLYAQRSMECALIPQDSGLVKNLSAFHNTYMGSLRRHSTWYNLVNLIRPLSREIGQVKTILERLQIGEKLFAPVAELSGGEQQRVCVARALFQRARVLIADEPVSALDIKQSNNVLSVIRETHETAVLALHDIALALRHSDRVIGLRDGRIALDARARGLSSTDLHFLYS
jgi:phosphonate transport system ATP-binding protein